MKTCKCEIISKYIGITERKNMEVNIHPMTDDISKLNDLKDTATTIIDTLLSGGEILINLDFGNKESWLVIDNQTFNVSKIVISAFEGKSFCELQYAMFLLRNLINAEADLEECLT